MVGLGEAVPRHSRHRNRCIKASPRCGCSQASTPAPFPQSHQTVNNSSRGFHGIQQIRSPALMANFFYLHGAYNEIRRLTLVCGLISEGNVDGGVVDWRKASGALVLLKVPELLSSVSLLISLIIGHSLLHHLCPSFSVVIREGGCSSEYSCKL